MNAHGHRAPRSRVTPLAWPLIPMLAWAASVAAQPRPDPLDAQARVPAATAPTALRGYRPPRELPPIAWREANATVDGIGGWRAYAREAQAAGAPPAPAAASAASSAAPAAPASAAHGDHHKP